MSSLNVSLATISNQLELLRAYAATSSGESKEALNAFLENCKGLPEDHPVIRVIKAIQGGNPDIELIIAQTLGLLSADTRTSPNHQLKKTTFCSPSQTPSYTTRSPSNSVTSVARRSLNTTPCFDTALDPFEQKRNNTPSPSAFE